MLPGAGEPERAAVVVRVGPPTFTAPDGATGSGDGFASAVVVGQTHAGFTLDHDGEMRPAGTPCSDCAGGTS